MSALTAREEKNTSVAVNVLPRTAEVANMEPDARVDIVMEEVVREVPTTLDTGEVETDMVETDTDDVCIVE